MKKNIKTLKKQATQEFFPKAQNGQKSESVKKEQSKEKSQKDGKAQYIFNKAPINKNEAYKERKNTLLEKQDYEERKKASGVEKSSFLKKLYEDEDELNELKVLGVLDDDDEDIKDIQNQKAEEGAFIAKRKAKAIDKMGSIRKSASIKQEQESSRVGRLSLKKGSISLFAICEIADNHLIVNHSRNTKGYVPLKGTVYENNAQKFFKLGQYIVAYVASEIGQVQISQSSANPVALKQKQKKVQLSIDLSLINQQLSIKSVSTNMVLQGQILSKEEKGYVIDFGFKDQTKGFLKFTNEKSKNFKIGYLVHFVIKSVIESSKVIKGELLTPTSHSSIQDCVQQKGNDSQSSDHLPSSINQIKPGFLVSGKVFKIYENGIELTFMGGLQGTIFQDHLQNQNDSSSLRNDPSDFKIGQKVIARVLSVDQISKKVTLSLKNNMIQWQSFLQIDTLKSLKIGQLFENVTILQEVYGGSFLIQLNDKVTSFLHKTHFQTPQNQEDIEMNIENETIKEKQQKQEEFKIGDKMKSVKIKEINWFDCMPIVSLRDEIIKTSQLSYNDLQVGQFITAKIKKVDQIGRYISLSINGFLKGKLYIQHMSENPIKMIPPKLQELEKEIKVRVLNIDSQKRLLEFTKKDSLMREDCPVFKNYKDIKVGDEYVGVVVSSNQYGYITNSFGNLKGLLTFASIEQKKLDDKKFQESNFKVGSILRAYCLFKKADQGVALTLSKNNALKNEKDQSLVKSYDAIEFTSSIDEYFPTESEINEIQNNENYIQALEYVDKVKSGQVQQFRLIENSQDKKYVILKSTDCEKKKRNFLAILPKCLIESNLTKNNLKLDEDQTYKGLVLQFIGESFKIPVISIQKQLVDLKDDIFSKDSDTKMSQGENYIGIVNGISGKANHVSVRFLNGITRSIKVKDLNIIQNYQKVYNVGKVVRVGINKLERLCIKEKVILACSQKLNSESDKLIQIKSFATSFGNQDNQIKIGDCVEAKIQLIKDYGIITQIQQNNNQFTGFITNQQKLNEKKLYKQGENLQCIVLDVDFEKKIVDLSEILADKKIIKNQLQEIKEGQTYKAFVELNKESYLVLSIKNQRQKIGICLLQNFNNDDAVNPYQSVLVGDEIEVKVVGVNKSGFLELIRIQKSQDKKRISEKQIDLSEGTKLSCKIKSIKNNQIFFHLNSRNNQIVLGRLHLIECESLTDFNQFQQGQQIDVKVLKASADLQDSNIQNKKNASWVELTRLPIHMKKSDGLDKTQQQRSLIQLNDLKVNQVVNDAIIIEALNFKNSNPLQVQISPFIRGYIPFNHIVSLNDYLKHGSNYFYSQRFQVGQKVKASYIGNQQFSLLENKQVQQFKKGELVLVRFVKIVYGRGVTVQMDDKTYGFIETCEITDEIIGNVFKLCESKSIFAARIIDQDTKGKWQLSSRESVVDDINWKRAVGPEGSSKQFQDLDSNIQKQGNQRNKILKYGASVALSRNDLCVGYIINIVKAGCFIQIGHNCVVRAGLNELSDQVNFDFQNQMPIGRLVVGRITKIDEQSSGQKNFHFSLRQSLVVYGVGSVERSKLQLEQEVTSIVMAIAEGKAFCQIKGSYIKIKVKTQGKLPKNLKIGDHVISKITKITKEKISSLYISKAGDAQFNEIPSQFEQISENIYKNVNSEAQKNEVLQELKEFVNTNQKKQENDFDVEKVDKIIGPEEEIAKQIEDLRNLERQEESLEIEDEEMSSAENDDSDEEEMKRLIQLDQESEDDIDQDLDDYDDEEGEIEQSDEEIKNQSDQSEESKKESQLKKRTLKERIKEEQYIRQQEKRMRSDTEQPKDIDDFERLLISNKDQAYLWIQYMAFMLDNVGIDAARKVVERAVNDIPMTNEQEKINIWTAYMNLENNFGSQEQLEKIIKRALEVNDRKKIYLNLVDIYKVSMKFEFIEAIYKQLCKKYGNNLEIWSAYLEFLIEMKQRKDQGKEFIIKDFEFTEPKAGLQKGLQALSKDQHVNLISKYGILEFKYGYPENGRTIFEGIITNYPKRMDIWSIYMDMEIKYGQNNLTQARHLFERCLSNDYIQKKPKKMKLVFQKYMEFENKHGNKQNLQKLRERVEQYLSKAYPDQDESAEDS